MAGSQGTPGVYYEAPDKTTWWSRIGDLAGRVEFLGSWAVWLALALSAGGVVLALVVMLRSDRDPAP